MVTEQEQEYPAHRPVLLEEAIDALNIKPDGFYVDGTFGRGGHTAAMLEKLSSKGKLVVIDKDPEAIKVAEELYGKDKRVLIRQGSFTKLVDWISELGKQDSVDGVLLDLGVSSPQLNEARRGFSFLRDGPLDMRMNPSVGIDAATWLRQVKVDELATVLRTYGEERYAKRIAKAIVESERQAPILTTKELAEIIASASAGWEKHKHPATRSFQAIRIFINKELEELETVLEQSVKVLKQGGRLVVISFHSLEDRIVKQFIRKGEKGDEYPLGLPVKQEQIKSNLKHIGKAVMPSQQEMKGNPRARSAVLRVAEKR